eukprot:CAMPEP_0185623576 /NCGR_PEP_ID=MMETSP0436-20130131/59972_1 /TAXON_ID=626734 ORGANISM="Favella taraikaensis, Strain Fe Narragansett Bay" /NCGR_SAMPLE_ID=MMETSP0436 /ASSEMBLY_ACC=CAM_ASM_000390 /LENGTH=112 /DNA_ID=CAMNT_0028265669 /DNA_START=367 /DNA_END=705 /DNA_ORIENTATION=+
MADAMELACLKGHRQRAASMILSAFAATSVLGIPHQCQSAGSDRPQTNDSSTHTTALAKPGYPPQPDGSKLAVRWRSWLAFVLCAEDMSVVAPYKSISSMLKSLPCELGAYA